MQNTRQADTSLRSLLQPIELSKNDSVAGTIFYKQVFTYGSWVNPMYWLDGEPEMQLTREVAQKMVENFDNNVLGDKVSVPLNHTSDVTANTGEVVKFVAADDGLYAYLDIKRPNIVEDIKNGLIFGVSLGFNWDYVSQKDSTHFGPTAYHVALVTEPYINNTTGFIESIETELSKRTAQLSEDLRVNGERSVIMLSKSKAKELRDMIKLSKVTNPHDYETTVTYTDADGKEQTVKVAAKAEVEVPETVSSDVEKQLTDAQAPEAPTENLPADDPKNPQPAPAPTPAETPTTATPAEGVITDSEKEELAKLRSQNAELSAEKAYNELAQEGRITPAQKDKFMELAKSSSVIALSKDKNVSVTDALKGLFSAGPKLVDFSEKGSQNGAGTVELSADEAKAMKAMGVDPSNYQKHVEAGRIKESNEE